MHEYAPLRELAYQSLETFRHRGYVRPTYIERLIEEHRTGHASYYGVMVWILMMLEQWLTTHGH
jgi:asparagine synthase (glutamine-hydrolysing)